MNRMLFDTHRLKEKFTSEEVVRKKLYAIENYIHANFLASRDFLKLKDYTLIIRSRLDVGFSDPEEIKFLDYLLDKYKIKFLEWAYKIKWVRDQIAAKKLKKMEEIQISSEQLFRSIALKSISELNFYTRPTQRSLRC